MDTHIVVNLRVEGFHNWPDAKMIVPEADFLSDRHRHIFHIKASKGVEHDDRDVEIILFKREIEKYLKNQYGSPCEFDSKSCEMIASELVEEFDLTSCEVLEDGENGAVVLG